MKSIEFESAQNVKVEYELASVAQRVGASTIDITAFFLYYLLLSIVLNVSMLGISAGEGALFTMLLLRLPWVFYNPIIEYLTHGQSLGKYVFGIRVVTISGERPGLREVFTRWMFRGDFLWLDYYMSGMILLWPVIGIMGIVYAGTSDRRQRMGDVMANTIVIRNQSSVRYTLRDVLSIKSQDNYTPVYPSVVRFTDEDMLLIKNTIQRVRTYPNDETKKFAIQLADESARLIGLEETPAKRLEFLQTLLQDYVVLTR